MNTFAVIPSFADTSIVDIILPNSLAALFWAPILLVTFGSVAWLVVLVALQHRKARSSKVKQGSMLRRRWLRYSVARQQLRAARVRRAKANAVDDSKVFA